MRTEWEKSKETVADISGAAMLFCLVTDFTTKRSTETKRPISGSNPIIKNPAKSFLNHKNPLRDLIVLNDWKTKK